ncbi:LysM peptidoglycan-binding domain-containing protein [Corallococcus sp. CA054B]|uniref:C39 family peptidase n=1 Tax=Corallococcus sp. CA054B TaxID=2316734 RepID=UPI000EA1238B|nr:C39 family peptidase [Corallococcus sp. CA054B]RKG67086.1 LysM peptidoglycan-binding domain-containing protein [Corallococcus sp. CA054B]
MTIRSLLSSRSSRSIPVANPAPGSAVRAPVAHRAPDGFEPRRPVVPQAPRPSVEDLREAVLRSKLKDAAGALRDGKKEDLGDALRQAVLRERLRDVGEALRGAFAPPAPATTTYTIQPGDTVGDIAWNLMQQGVPGPVEAIANQIVQLNGLSNPDLIIAGETLQLPAAPGSAPGTPGASPGTPSGMPGTGGPSAPGNPSGPARPGERYPVPFIKQMSSQGTEDDWNQQSNCGPTTMAMILKGYGIGTEMSDGAFINQLGQGVGITSAGVGYSDIQRMAANNGLTSEVNPGTDVGWIEQQLASGNLVAVNGESNVMLQNESPPFTSGSFSGGHWIAVTGMTAEGNFIVHDPSSTVTELTPAELQRFLGEHQYGGYSVAIHPPAGVAPTDAPGQALESVRLAPGAMSLAESGFAGQGEFLMRMAQKYDVPIDLALAMLWKESQWGTAGASVGANNPGNLKFVGQEGAHEAFTSPGASGSFAGWPTLEQGIEAYFKLLGTHYRAELDSGDWTALVNRYAPPSENDSGLYVQQVNSYAAEVRRQLGIG